MKIYNISFQSLRRKKSKTLLLISGITIAVAAAVALYSISMIMNSNIEHELDEFGANIIITPKSDNLTLNYGGISLGSFAYNQSTLSIDDATKIKEIKNSKNINVISPKLYEMDTVKSQQVLIAGIRFNDEVKLKKWWEISGTIPGEKNEVLLGATLAAKFNLSPKDTLRIKGKTFIISGEIKPTGSNDDVTIFLNLSTAQQLFKRNKDISLMEVSALCYDCPMDTIVTQTASLLPNATVTAIKQSIDSKMKAVKNFTDFSLGIVLLILIISILIVFTAVNSSVNERVREIGLFKAVGLRNREIFNIIFVEIFLASGTAGIAGYILGIVTANAVFPIFGGGHTTGFIFNPGLFPAAVAFSILVAIAASFYPAYKAAKLDPTVAFRTL